MGSTFQLKELFVLQDVGVAILPYFTCILMFYCLIKTSKNYPELFCLIKEFISSGQVVPAHKCFLNQPNAQLSYVVGVASGLKCHLNPRFFYQDCMTSTKTGK